MNVQCELCETVYRVDPEKVPVGGTHARCTVCSNVIALLSDEPSEPAADSTAQVAAALGDAYIPVPLEEQGLPLESSGAPTTDAPELADSTAPFTHQLESEVGEPSGGPSPAEPEPFGQFPIDPVEPAAPSVSDVEPLDVPEPVLPEIPVDPTFDEFRPVAEPSRPVDEPQHSKPFVDNDLQDLSIDPAASSPPVDRAVPQIPPAASAPLASSAPQVPAPPPAPGPASDAGQLTPPWDAMAAQLDSIMPTGDQARPGKEPSGEKPASPSADGPVDVAPADPAPTLESRAIPTPPVKKPDPHTTAAPTPSPGTPRAPGLRPLGSQPVRDQRSRLSRPFSAPISGAPAAPPDSPSTVRPTAPVFRPTPGTPVQEPPSPPSPPVVDKPSVPAAAPAAPAPEPPKRPVNPFLSKDPRQKARRLARALISDMIVYQPEKRQKAMRDGTLKEVFDHEIKKSWEEFVDQVGDEIANSTTHFNDALNEILAGGKQVF